MDNNLLVTYANGIGKVIELPFQIVGVKQIATRITLFISLCNKFFI